MSQVNTISLDNYDSRFTSAKVTGLKRNEVLAFVLVFVCLCILLSVCFCSFRSLQFVCFFIALCVYFVFVCLFV